MSSSQTRSPSPAAGDYLPVNKKLRLSSSSHNSTISSNNITANSNKLNCEGQSRDLEMPAIPSKQNLDECNGGRTSSEGVHPTNGATNILSTESDVDSALQGIDANLYSRQLYTLGVEAMLRMSRANVLLIGLDGVGVEIAKNIVLGGVKSVSLLDCLSSQKAYVSSPEWISCQTNKECNKTVSRIQSCQKYLSDLNPYVQISRLQLAEANKEEHPFSPSTCHDELEAFVKKLKLNEELAHTVISRFSVVVCCTDVPLNVLIDLNSICHSKNIPFISATSFGLFANIFCDFGSSYMIKEKDSNSPNEAMISHITNDATAVVTTLDENRHSFENGDLIRFTEVEGMTQLNSYEGPICVKVLGPYAFVINVDTRSFPPYIKGGCATQIKVAQKASFKSYAESFLNPEIVTTESSKFATLSTIHLGFKGLKLFHHEYNRLPKTMDEGDVKKFVDIVDKINNDIPSSNSAHVDSLNVDVLTIMSKTGGHQLCPINSVIGGLAAQEVIKATTSKFIPITQWLYFDSIELYSLISSHDTEPFECEDAHVSFSQCKILGAKFQQIIEKQKVFLVGAGAIGCELMKNFAMMSLGASDKGKLIVTDMDTIEKSNLNRQLLFRSSDIGKLKSEVACSSVQLINPKMNVEFHSNRVGVDTEKVYNDAFFNELDIVVNALDNTDARIYMDLRCVFYRKPLLESGTLGTKGNIQVVVPFLTESYSVSQDPPEKEIPICTLKNFPNNIEHTVQWARDTFEGLFKNGFESARDFVNNLRLNSSRASNKMSVEIYNGIKYVLITEFCQTFDDCIRWARLKFSSLFCDNIQQLLYNFPPNQLTTTGLPFWSGQKRCPKPIFFDASNYHHLNFIVAASFLKARNYNIKSKYVNDIEYIISIISEMVIPEFKPKSGVFIAANEAEEKNHQSSTSDTVNDISELVNFCSKNEYNFSLNPIEFEKDEDGNFHVEFIAAASNFRAMNYSIQPISKHETKRIAGKIIPAIATTTSIVAGLVCLEMYKVVCGRADKLSDYRNFFLNLELPFVEACEPLAPKRNKVFDDEWTQWDRYQIVGDMTLREFIAFFKEQKLVVSVISNGVALLYADFMDKKKKDERMAMLMPQLVAHVSKKKLDVSRLTSLIFEVAADDEDGNDIEIPYVHYIHPQKQQSTLSSKSFVDNR